MLSNIPITGLTVLSAFGSGLPKLAAAIKAQTRGMHYGHRFQEWISAPLAELPLDDLGIPEELRLQSDQVMRQVCLQMLAELSQSTGVFQRYRPREIGLFLGTTTSGIDGFSTALKNTKKLTQAQLSLAMQQAWITEQVRSKFPIAGPCISFSSSCAAAAQAIAQAYDCVRSGIVPAAIAGGIDILNLVTILGFDSLQILDHDYCEPFSPQRKGINLGEGGAFFLIEAKPEGPSLAHIKGYAAVSEAYHMTQPDPSGLWMQTTMQKALQSAEIKAADISYLNAHGTGTSINDAAESIAIDAIFGARPPMHASKRYTAHTLGAAGALELAISLACLQDSTIWSQEADLPLNPEQDHIALSNSFGFGGTNLSLVLSGGK